MGETRRADGSPLLPGERDYLIHCAACHGADRSGNPPAGFPSLLDLAGCRTRPEVEALTKTGFGRMPSFDRLGDDQRRAILKWKVPLGEYRELTARGIPPTGTENYGGPVVTTGGVLVAFALPEP